LIGTLWALLLHTASAAQASASGVDAHIATARAAAGQDYRATFMNLCLPSASTGGGRAAGPAAAARGDEEQEQRQELLHGAFLN